MSVYKIDKIYKQQLAELLAEGHRKFGKVAPKRPYRDDEDEGGGGDGSAELLFETHPLLAQQPVGASSDLTSIITDNKNTIDEADKRSDEAKPELRKALENVHAARASNLAKPTPY